MSDPQPAGAHPQPAEPAPIAQWEIPGTAAGTHFLLEARPGEVTCIVGPNGAGKSALGTWLDREADTGTVSRIIAHRQLWFSTAGPDVTASQRESNEQYQQTANRRPESRYLDEFRGQRAGSALFDLLAMETDEHRRDLALWREGTTPEQIVRQFGRPVFDRLNDVLHSAGLRVRIDPGPHQLVAAHDMHTGATYPVFQMSDGEKSALLLTAEVLTLPTGRVVIIDEPERHLHRAISAGLVEAVIDQRPDCHFVILTHDLPLADRLGTHPGRTLVLTGSSWSDQTASGWDLDTITDHGLPEAARAAILGGRTRVLLIEGDTTSHDQRLYRLLFPGWDLQPAGGADQVIHAVTGLADTDRHHRLHARGIVDGDARDDTARADLAARGILALGVSEIENVYYLDCVLNAVSTAQAAHLGDDADQLRTRARQAALNTLTDEATLARLAAGVAMKAVRLALTRQMPTTPPGDAARITVTATNPYPRILADAHTRSAADDLQGLIQRLPVRDTSLRDRVARALRYPDIATYEAAATRLIAGSADLQQRIRAIIGTIPA